MLFQQIYEQMFTYRANDKTPGLREVAAHYPPHIKTVLRLLQGDDTHSHNHNHKNKNKNNNDSNNENGNIDSRISDSDHSSRHHISQRETGVGIGSGEVGIGLSSGCRCHPVAWCMLGSSCLSQGAQGHEVPPAQCPDCKVLD